MPTKSKPTVAALDPSCVWNPDKDAIALLALGKLPASRREQAFAIYQRDGANGLAEFCNSVAVPGDDDSFQFATDPKAGRLAGIAHTHPPGGVEGSRFSNNDLDVADALKRDSYVLDVPTGDVRKYAPGVTKTTRLPSARRGDRSNRTAEGDLVGNTRREQIAQAIELHSTATKE